MGNQKIMNQRPRDPFRISLKISGTRFHTIDPIWSIGIMIFGFPSVSKLCLSLLSLLKIVYHDEHVHYLQNFFELLF